MIKKIIITSLIFSFIISVIAGVIQSNPFENFGMFFYGFIMIFGFGYIPSLLTVTVYGLALRFLIKSKVVKDKTVNYIIMYSLLFFGLYYIASFFDTYSEDNQIDLIELSLIVSIGIVVGAIYKFINSKVVQS